MQAESALVYLPDVETIADLHPEWPSDMCAALCLAGDGSCEIVVFHADESGEALIRVAQLTGRNAAGFVVFPPREANPARKMSFAEEQALCRVLADASGLAEFAADYALNYRYALESEAIIRAPGGRTETGFGACAPKDVPDPPIAAFSRSEDIHTLSRRRSNDLYARIFPTGDAFRLTIHGGEPPLRVGDALHVDRVDADEECGRVRLHASVVAQRPAMPGDSFMIQRAVVPDAVAARWETGEGHATISCGGSGCLILEEYRIRPHRRRLSRVAATLASYVSACTKRADVKPVRR